MKVQPPKTINEYLMQFPADIQKKLEQIRKAIKKTAPGAEEAIKYSMPAFVYNGSNLVYFAAYKKHIGFYPVPVGDALYLSEIKPYHKTKGALQFPVDTPVPIALVVKIVRLRMKEIQNS